MRILVLVVALMLVVGAGCGDSDSSPGGDCNLPPTGDACADICACGDCTGVAPAGCLAACRDKPYDDAADCEATQDSQFEGECTQYCVEF
jgi:hypothetical protein